MAALELAESLLKSGNAAGALRLLRESAAPGLAREVLVARCCLRLGDVAGALAAYLAVLALDDRNVEAASAVATLYFRQGLAAKAEAHLSRCLKKIDDDQLRVDHAVLLYQTGQPERALAALEKVIARNPGHYGAGQQLAALLLARGRNEDAAMQLRAMVGRFPERQELQALLGKAEYLCGRFEDAVPCLEAASAHRPGDVRLLKLLAQAFIMSGEIGQANAVLEVLHKRDPVLWQEVRTHAGSTCGAEDVIDPRPIFLVAAYHQQEACDWRRRQRFAEVLRDCVASPGATHLFALAHFTGLVSLSPDERLRFGRAAAQAVARGLAPQLPPPPSPAPARLRVGYVLARIADHVVPIILRKLLEAHDPGAVELHVIAVGQRATDAGSDMPQRYALIPGLTLHDLSALDDAAAAVFLRELGCDILVDLAVYNDGARPGILARRPAPVQVSYLGAPFTSGAPWLDYIITDPVLSPEDPHWCSEAEVKMPVCYFSYGHEDATPPAVPPRASQGLPENRFLFSALTNPYKIDPHDLDSWGRILAATPGSLLLLKDQGKASENLRREALQRGIDPERLLFLPLVSQRDYLLRQGMPDLFLDTRFYGAHTTMAESLWMGVPAISWRGDSFHNRVGASLLASCGLDELVATDARAYEELAIALFHDRERLQRLKAQLLAVRLGAAPFDLPGQARALEAAFRHMRQRFADGLPPAPFDIATLPGAGRGT